MSTDGDDHLIINTTGKHPQRNIRVVHAKQVEIMTVHISLAARDREHGQLDMAIPSARLETVYKI